MNNEEKILQLLTSLTEKVDDMDRRLDRLEIVQAKQGEQLTAVQATQAKQEEQTAEMQDTLTRVAVTQEGVVLPRIQALYEGHGVIMEKLDKLASQEQVDEHESDISMMKDTIKRHRVEIDKLKKAQ